nr:KH domain-containing protein [Bacilli bacterium]
MKELVELIARNLVDQPDRIHVKEIEGERATTYELSVASEDMGKIIGKGGRIIKSMRTVVTAAAMYDHRRVHIEVR